jgi:hypothetical protein
LLRNFGWADEPHFAIFLLRNRTPMLAVPLRRTLHVEGLVRPLVVVAIDEVVELGLLLLQEVAGGWFGGLQL